MLWGEIKVDSDDLKHMVHRNGGFIELYNNIMTCLGDLGLLLAVPPWGRSGVERRLVLACRICSIFATPFNNYKNKLRNNCR